MAGKPRLLFLCDCDEAPTKALGEAAELYEIECVRNPVRALVRMARESFDGVFVPADQLREVLDLARVSRNNQILEGMPDGVALLDQKSTIIWANKRLTEWAARTPVLGANFYRVLGNPEILGPNFCPFYSAFDGNSTTSSTLRCNNRYYHVHAVPVVDPEGPPQYLIVTVRDETQMMNQQQKLTAIHRAGLELADLSPRDLLQMTVEERIELLKSNILHCTRDILRFEVVEIRLLTQGSDTLKPLLAVGMDIEAIDRELRALPHGNGITGFVAATGKSYLCEDTTEDPLYLPGSSGAKSSLTVPLMMHDTVIGTFNVESPQPRAFSEDDLQFLEIFTRDVAMAINTLELLVAEKASTAVASVEAIHSAVALPVDQILNDAVNVIERYIGHEPEVVERLQRILRNARDIKQVIQKVGQKMAPSSAHPLPPTRKHRGLAGRRVLLADADQAVRSTAHDLLERYECSVETAPDGAQALFMVRNSMYDVIICDIRLPDMNGYELLVELSKIMARDPLPVIFMTGFGYDPGHSIVKARQAGHDVVVLYKPFGVDQLLNAMEKVVRLPEKRDRGSRPGKDDGKKDEARAALKQA